MLFAALHCIRVCLAVIDPRPDCLAFRCIPPHSDAFSRNPRQGGLESHLSAMRRGALAARLGGGAAAVHEDKQAGHALAGEDQCLRRGALHPRGGK